MLYAINMVSASSECNAMKRSLLCIVNDKARQDKKETMIMMMTIVILDLSSIGHIFNMCARVWAVWGCVQVCFVISNLIEHFHLSPSIMLFPCMFPMTNIVLYHILNEMQCIVLKADTCTFFLVAKININTITMMTNHLRLPI